MLGNIGLFNAKALLDDPGRKLAIAQQFHNCNPGRVAECLEHASLVRPEKILHPVSRIFDFKNIINYPIRSFHCPTKNVPFTTNVSPRGSVLMTLSSFCRSVSHRLSLVFPQFILVLQESLLEGLVDWKSFLLLAVMVGAVSLIIIAGLLELGRSCDSHPKIALALRKESGALSWLALRNILGRSISAPP
jgi:hypothetical protein